MKESIYIKNLGPIKCIEIEGIKPFTVLIGESGSGKSTLMKVIALFRWIYKMQNIRSYLKHSGISKSPFTFSMGNYIKNCGFEQFINADTDIIYSIKSSKENQYKIRYSNNKLTVLSGNETIKKDDIQFNKISFISETRNIIPLWSDKGASLTGSSLGFYFNEVYQDFNLASEHINELELSYLNLKLAIKNTNSGKKYSIKSKGINDFEIDFKNSSSGIQNSVPISLITEHFSKNFNFEKAFNKSVLNYLSNTDNLTDFKPTRNLKDIKKQIFLHIEEPELSLYPDAQCQLINDIINKSFITNSNSIEVFLSTHSPYIINHLNLLIKANEKDQLINGAKITYDKISVYQVVDGKIEDLMIKNEKLINTNLLSDTINNIYDQYAELE